MRDMENVLPLLEVEVATVIVGLETLRGPAALAEILHRIDPARIVFSLDLRGGRLIIANGASWASANPENLVEEVMSIGVRRILLLDLAQVGRSQGTGTRLLLDRLVTRYATARGGHLNWIVGGGISEVAEIESLGEAGASAVLVGSALHDGRIGSIELAGLERRRLQIKT